MYRSAGRSRICRGPSSSPTRTTGVIPGVAGPVPFVPFKTFQIVESGELYIERLNQLDFRVAKIFRFGATRTNLNFDFYNVLNANSVIGENFAYGPTWRQPTSILMPRLFKIRRAVRFLRQQYTTAGRRTVPALRTVGRVLLFKTRPHC